MSAANSWDDATLDRELGRLYYTAGDPASYGGIERLYERARELGIPADRRA